MDKICKPKHAELIVIVRAKELAAVVFEVCELAPKKFRQDLLPAMRNAALDIVRYINRANNTYIDVKLLKDLDRAVAAAEKMEAARAFDEPPSEFEQLRLFALKLAKAFKHEERVSRRLEYSFEAMNFVNELEHLITLATGYQAITLRQRERLSDVLDHVKNLIGAFIKSDKKRYGYE
jgi:hypothetical protein